MIKRMYLYLLFSMLVFFVSAPIEQTYADEDKSNFTRALDIIFRRGLSYKVDENANFIGDGLVIPQAPSYSSWLLADLNSLAMKSAFEYEKPPTGNGVSYLRSYFIDGDIGFVWQWLHLDVPIYLFYHFNGDSGYIVRTIHNTHAITVDEAIIVMYYSDLRASYKPFLKQKWETGDGYDKYYPEALGFLGDSLFRNDERSNSFEGKILSTGRRGLSIVGGELGILDVYGENFIALPKTFLNELDNSIEGNLINTKEYLDANLKIILGADGQITKVIAGEVYKYDSSNKELVVFSKAVPVTYLGAGSLSSDFEYGRD